MPPRVMLDDWTFFQFFGPGSSHQELNEDARSAIEDAVKQREVCISVWTYARFRESAEKASAVLIDKLGIGILNLDQEVVLALARIPSTGKYVDDADKLTLAKRLIAATALRHNVTLISVTRAIECEGLEYIYAKAGRVEGDFAS